MSTTVYAIRTMLNSGVGVNAVAKSYGMTRLQVAKMKPQKAHKDSEIPELAHVKADYAEDGELSEQNKRDILERYTKGVARILPYATHRQISDYIGCPNYLVYTYCGKGRVLIVAERLLGEAA